jgi:hypothetical protein
LFPSCPAACCTESSCSWLGENMPRRAGLWFGLLIVVAALSAAAGDKPTLRGSDGQLDASNYLATRGGFLPVPILITEPAVGYGGGLAALFFHGGNPLTNPERGPGDRAIPPSISGAAAFFTENGSKGGALLHFGVMKHDHIRYIGVLGGASLNLDYWGTTGRPRPEPLQYGVSGALTIQRILFRLGDSPLFVGGEASYSTQNAEFKSALLPPDAPPRKLDQTDAGVGVVSEFETLDNIFTPNRGMKARVVGKVFSKNLGGDNDRQTLDVESFGYVSPHRRVILGLRGDLKFSDGTTPFYLLPYVDLRGLPALKYTGKHVASGELEGRFNIYGRWSAVAFGGLGFVSDKPSELLKADPVGTRGVGFRYLIAERYGIHMGLDYARGPDDYAIYIIVGNAWR